MWLVEFYKYYLFRKSFTIITDYRAILSIMKDHRSYKIYNSQLSRWVDRSLHFEYNIDHGRENGAGRLHFSLTKSISKSYKQIWWGICCCNNYPHSWRNCSIYIYSTPQNCQSHRFIGVNHTDSTGVSIAQQTNHSKMLSALNLRTNQLLLSHSANAAQIQPSDNLNMSTSNTSQQTPPKPATSRVIFQSTPNSAVNSTHSSNEGPTSPKWELSKKEVFENNFTQLFTKGFLAVLKSKDAG